MRNRPSSLLGNRASRARLATVAGGLALAFFAIAHSFEDFAHDVPQERFGVDPTAGAVMLAAAFVVQGVIIALAASGSRLGYAGSLAVAVAWLVAAVADHAGDLVDETFRTLVSDVLILGIIVTSIALAVAAAGALRGERRH